MKPVWEVVRDEIVLPILKDEAPPSESGRKPRYDHEVLASWWNNAQSRLATMKPLQRHQIYKDDGVVVPLPEQHYKPRSVHVSGYPEPLPRTSIDQQFMQPGSPAYYITEGKLVLAGTPDTVMFLYSYSAYYRRVANEPDKVEVPEWAWEACGLYVAMQAVTREAMADARYRKFATKTDAGNPTHNPFLPVAKWLESRFEAIVKLHVDDDEDYG